MDLESVNDLDPIIPDELLNRRTALVINVSAIKTATGPLWDKLAKSVFLRLEKILRRVLTPSDCFAVVDDIRYVVTIQSFEAVDAAVVAVRIACELTFEILGHCDMEQIRIERVTARQGRSLSTSAVTGEEISKLVERAHVSGVGGVSVRRQGAAEPNRSAFVAVGERAGLAISHRFEPVWDMHHEAISTYICRPDIIRTLDDNDEVAHDTLTLKERSIVELSCIATGVGYLSEFVEKGDRFVLGVSVDFETLCSPLGRMEFVRICRGLPAAYRPYLLFLLANVPLGVTQSRLSDLASLIRPFGRAAASVASGCRNFNAYQGHGFCALSLDFGRDSQDIAGRTRDIVHVAAAANNARLGSIALGLNDTQLVNQACAADIQMLQGAAIATTVDQPRRMTRLARSRVLEVDAEAAEVWF